MATVSDVYECLILGASDGKFWEFTADLAKGDTAYTNMALGAHTDNTYFVRGYTARAMANVYPYPFRQTLPDFNSSTSSHTRTDQVAQRS